MPSNLITWFEIFVQGVSRARACYEKVLGCALLRLPVDSIATRAFPGATPEGPAQHALMQIPGLPSGGNGCLRYFECADCGEAAAREESVDGHCRG
jgi:predicted enzyme related to lactoylglutathione lyase